LVEPTSTLGNRSEPLGSAPDCSATAAREEAQAKAAIANNRKKYPERWYLTIVSRKCCCNRCGRTLRDGGELVYRHRPKEVVCLDCPNRDGVRYRPSVRWERRNSKGRTPVARTA
jgi:hypothetical protein